MNNMKQKENFIKCLRSQTRIILDAFTGGTISQMIEPQIKHIIVNMCMNEYRAKSEKLIKLETMGTPKGMLPLDTHTTLLAQIELLNKKLVEGSLGRANMS